MYVNDTPNCQLCTGLHSGIVLQEQEGKAASDKNSLCVLGSLADLQQGTFDVTYLPFFPPFSFVTLFQ